MHNDKRYAIYMHPDGTKMRKQYAVFDIDGTIARTSLLQQFVRVLVHRGMLDIGIGQQIETLLHDSRQRIADDEFSAYMNQAVELLFKSLPHKIRVDEYMELIDVVVKSSLSSTYVYTRQLIQTLKRNNFFLITISGSEMRMVATLSKALGFDAWVGKVNYLEQDHVLSGHIQTLSHSKSEILTSIISKFDLDTRGSLAVGDTSSDIPILSMVENPIVFNPNQALFTHAQKNGWMIVLERKDMVYGLSNTNGQYILSQTNAGA